MRKRIYSILVCFLLGSLAFQAQGRSAAPVGEYASETGVTDRQLLDETRLTLLEYITEMNDLLIALSVFPNDSLNTLQREYQKLDSKWNTYYEALLMDIASSKELLDLVAQYQQVNRSATEALDRMKTEAEAKNDFLQAEGFILSQKTVYATMYKEAMSLQQVKQLAPQLEKLKAKEQTIIVQVEEKYQQARKAVDTDPTLATAMEQLDDNYFELKNQSAAIQAAVYKSFIERIKDKLLVGAALAIIMMFISMITARIQAIKNAREMAKKFKSQFTSDNDYPTI